MRTCAWLASSTRLTGCGSSSAITNNVKGVEVDLPDEKAQAARHIGE